MGRPRIKLFQWHIPWFFIPNFLKKRHGKIRWPSMSGHRIFPHCFLAPVTYYSGNTQIIHPFKYFDRIGASPPCTEYSIGMQAGVRKIEQAEIVMRTLEAIRYILQTGLVHRDRPNRAFAASPYFVDHCKHGFPYRRRTRLWANLDTSTLGPLCKKHL